MGGVPGHSSHFSSPRVEIGATALQLSPTPRTQLAQADIIEDESAGTSSASIAVAILVLALLLL